jgi:hypothetical protein
MHSLGCMFSAAALLMVLQHVLPYRNNVRSEARYIASFEPDVTYGTGFVPSLALLAKFGAYRQQQ